MGTVRREGRWSLDKKRNGVYEIRERGELRAKILTADYEPAGMFDDESMDVMTETIEVETFSDAERTFQNYIEKQESGGGFGVF